MTHPLAGLSTRAPGREAGLLSDRQGRILRLVAEGKTNKAIASLLGYSESTVKLELSRTMELLKANDRQQAVQVARNLHLLEQAAPHGEVAG
ncbi:MAG: helix-turn-helix domain-containing protein [Actinomycetales bacterium]|nr:helix-turn-helix domain-containing protein [Actinomycetales bacterium]